MAFFNRTALPSAALSRVAHCADCGTTNPHHVTYTGLRVCDRCHNRRDQMGVLLALMVRGETPEALRAFVGLEAVARARDPDERQEMLDHVDLLLVVGPGSR